MEIKQYDFDLPVVRRIQKLIEDKYSFLFEAVIVHGSVATDEVIPYSDFDGLLIVKDEYCSSQELRKFKKESFEMILKFDPLQHHGWFLLKMSELKNYPNTYLPLAVLEHSRLIYPLKESIEITITITEEQNYVKNLLAMLEQFERRIEMEWKPRNMFQLKSVLSQIMLIPCLYYSALEKEGIFKKYSFSLMQEKFTREEWYCIEVASEIRKDWNYNMNFFQNLLMQRPERIFRKITQKYGAPAIPDGFSSRWDDKFVRSLQLIISKIKSTI